MDPYSSFQRTVPHWSKQEVAERAGTRDRNAVQFAQMQDKKMRSSDRRYPVRNYTSTTNQMWDFEAMRYWYNQKAPPPGTDRWPVQLEWLTRF
jgi:hypothetical protein